jgi:hypothetical protein
MLRSYVAAVSESVEVPLLLVPRGGSPEVRTTSYHAKQVVLARWRVGIYMASGDSFALGLLCF